MFFSENLSTPILNTIWIHKTQKIVIKIFLFDLWQSLTMWLSSDHVGAVYNSVWSWKQAKNCKIREIEKFLRKIEFLIQSLITYAVILAFHSTKECQTSLRSGDQDAPPYGYISAVFMIHKHLEDTLPYEVKRFFVKFPSVFALFLHFFPQRS